MRRLYFRTENIYAEYIEHHCFIYYADGYLEVFGTNTNIKLE